MMVRFLKRSLFYCLGRVAVFIVDTLLFTCRIDVVGEERVRPILKSGRYVFTSWHGRLILFFTSCRKGGGDAVMTSRSKDGAIAAQMQVSGGCRTFRGSSKKGGADALSQMGDYMKAEGKPAMLSIDGPTGPIYKAKSGAIRLASRTGFPIIPISFSCSRAKIFRSWDRCMIPKPFTRATIIYGEAIHIPKDLTESEVRKYMERVEAELMRITLEADAHHNQCPKALKTEMFAA